MYKEKIGKEFLVLPCFICGSKNDLEFQWKQSAGHGDSSFEVLQIHCCKCGYGVGSGDGYGSPELADKSRSAIGWNSFMANLSADPKLKSVPAEDKRFFQIMDEMNLEDVANGTRLVEVGTQLVRANMSNGGTEITMGAPAAAMFSLDSELKIPILLLVDKVEYFKRKN